MFWIGLAIFAYCVVSFAGAAIISEGVRARYTPLVVLHGLLVMGWIGLLALQARLSAGSRLVRHRAYGKLSIWLVLPMVIVGLVVMWRTYLEFGNVGLLFANFMIFAQFLLFYSWAIWAARTHRVDWHKRLMLFATMAMLGPAHGRFVRLFGFTDDAGAPITPLFILVLPLAYDLLTERKVTRPTWWLLGLSILIFAFMAWIVLGVLGL